jgi:hypothetical protein
METGFGSGLITNLSTKHSAIIQPDPGEQFKKHCIVLRFQKHLSNKRCGRIQTEEGNCFPNPEIIYSSSQKH